MFFADVDAMDDLLVTDTPVDHVMRTSLLRLAPREKLQYAKHILQLGLENVSAARLATALTDGNSLADVCWVKVRQCTTDKDKWRISFHSSVFTPRLIVTFTRVPRMMCSKSCVNH